MRRFILNLVIFFGAVLFLVALWSGLLIYCEYGRWLESCRMPEGKSVVVCCDSHTEVGLDPSIWPELFNISRSGTRFRQNYLRQLDLCRENRSRIKLALIDVSVIKYYLTQPDDEPDKRGEDQLATLELVHRSRSELPLGMALREFFTIVWQKQSKQVLRGVFGGRYKSLICGGFGPLGARLAVTQPGRFDQMIREWAMKINDSYRAMSAENRESPMLKWLQKSIDLYRDEGAEVILIQTPVHKNLRAAVATAAEVASRKFEEVAARNGIAFLNFDGMEVPDEEWADINHLNRDGARRLTKALSDRDVIRRHQQE